MAQMKWITDDGERFDNEHDAIMHENKMRFINWVKEKNRQYQEKMRVQKPPGDMAREIWENWNVKALLKECVNGQSTSS